MRTRKSRTEPIDQNRVCGNCKGPISARNKTGICARSHECRVAQQAKRNRGEGKRNPTALLLPPAYEIDDDGNRLLDKDGNPIEIIDRIAIGVTVEGIRRVGLTETERRLAVERMIKIGYRFREIADHIGTSPAKLRPVIEELGYELIPRRPAGRRQREATEIRKVKGVAS